ncbi:unnamed protein product [Gadus morhua 'NCC']
MPQIQDAALGTLHLLAARLGRTKMSKKKRRWSSRRKRTRKGAGMVSHSQPLPAWTLAMMLMLPLTLANDLEMDRSALSGKITLQG